MCNAKSFALSILVIFAFTGNTKSFTIAILGCFFLLLFLLPFFGQTAKSFFITPHEPRKTEQEVVLEKATLTKVSEITPETNEMESTHYSIGQEDIV